MNHRLRRPGALLWTGVILLGAVACTSTPTPTAMPSIVGSGDPTTSVSPSPSLVPPGSIAPSPGAGDVIADASLLDVLPPDIDGTPVAAEDEAFAAAADDPAFRRNVARAVFPIIAAGEDLASGVVAELVPNRYTEDFFRSWRDSYNVGACDQAGGVASNAEAELGGRTVYIATCTGGLRVYHAWLEERGIIVSLFSLGEARLGERLMADLRPGA